MTEDERMIEDMKIVDGVCPYYKPMVAKKIKENETEGEKLYRLFEELKNEFI